MEQESTPQGDSLEIVGVSIIISSIALTFVGICVCWWQLRNGIGNAL